MTLPASTDLIVALDVPCYEDAMDFVDSLDGTVTWLKVGLELFISDGAAVMQALKQRKQKIMLDLKLHDIPETVARATAQAIDLGADMLTIHTSGGAKMMEAAVKAASDKLKILGVTVLTSLDHEDMQQIGIGLSTIAFAQRLASLASLSGVPGLVCSVHDAAAILAAHPSMALVTPGIRLAGGEAGDQKRVATPALARAAGAHFIVVGRPIRDAKNRVAAVRTILAELQSNTAGKELSP